MNIQDDSTRWETARFGVGQPVLRKEDPKLLRGEGEYTDDLDVAGQAYAVMVRSRHAHGVIRAIHTETARGMPGVLGVFTGADLAEYGPMMCAVAFKNRDGSPMHRPGRPALPTDKVRFVGDPVAFVVAETADQARDAAETVELGIEALPPVLDLREAAKPDSPRVYDDLPSNVALDYHFGQSEAVSAAFARAAHVTRLTIVNTRVAVSAMEPRAAIGEHDAGSGRWTLHVGSQGVFGMRQQLVDILKAPRESIRVLTKNVGGSFGMKAAVYPEYVAVPHAARVLGRPVKWTADRIESFVSDHHGRDHEFDCELALDRDGTFLAWRVQGFADMGAYLGPVAPIMGTLNIVKNMVSVYRTPAIEVSSKCVFTNTTFVSAYRGAGRPEANYFMERLIDQAAEEMGLDRIELRRRNLIAPEQIPYKAPSDMVYDSGNFPRVLDRALEAADWGSFEQRRIESEARGKLRGLGLGCFLEVTAPPSKEMGGIRFEPDGTVTIITGTLDYGQGHATPFAQVLGERLGIPFERIRLLQGDSDELITGGGTGGSRSAYSSGHAIAEAAVQVIERGKQIASHVLEAAVSDIDFGEGRFSIAGTDRGIGILDLAAQLREGLSLPEGTPTSLDVSHATEAIPSAFPNGCHIAEVEIDPDDGQVEVVRYHSVNDFGTILNPMLVEGQLHGGIVQGIGQAIMEHVRYDADGQLITASYMDYALPRAHNTPMFHVESCPSPANTNLLGVKGCGEAGCAGALTSVMNAVMHALAQRGIRHFDMPASPNRVWDALRGRQT